MNHCSNNNKNAIFFTNIYKNVLKNIIVNKEMQYAIIWHPKCGCTTITDIFCIVNNIDFNKIQNHHLSLSWLYNRYKYNVYLQNTINFYRPPPERRKTAIFCSVLLIVII